MRCANVADTGSLKVLFGLIKLDNPLTLLQAVHPTEKEYSCLWTASWTGFFQFFQDWFWLFADRCPGRIYQAFGCRFLSAVVLCELTPEILREFVDKIIVHAPDKSSGRRLQEIEIIYNHIGEFDHSKVTLWKGNAV